jgi:hypothetical protein
MQRILRLLPCLIVILLFGCAAHKADWPPADWPENVVNNLWIPNKVMLSGYYHRGVYKVIYTVDTCYPAKALIEDMVRTMRTKGWKRLSYDPVNPSARIPLNHTLAPDGQWSSGLDKDRIEGYDWREFWSDDQNNIIEYRFEYKLEKGQKIENKCSLSGFSMYTDEALFRAILRGFQEKAVKPGS